ncbi:glycerol-3-phosphate 1-O-acyltransferase PlsY [Allofustis seminis]|uniref:glycerol-3-phosphate 1-O-acyltransferase PlsY n=1 Tax=Allofustis seminis TaxID=166939 RepID=UPI000367916F|nr:glycerol-3-phosphate 1-O-acyltransferase PlsY [Allofustis seminis]
MKYLLFIVIAYLLGSIPSGVWIGKYFFGKDIREYGSGNSGATNTYRVLGIKAGTVVIILDILKGTLAVLLPQYYGIDMHPLFFGIFACIGHAYPIFANFKGGKAVATTVGIILGTYPLTTLIGTVCFGTVLYLTSIVSISSIILGLSSLLCALFTHDVVFIAVMIILNLFIIYKHRDNIRRVKQKKERETSFGLHLLQKKKNQ